jgi:hypothetical protein
MSLHGACSEMRKSADHSKSSIQDAMNSAEELCWSRLKKPLRRASFIQFMSSLHCGTCIGAIRSAPSQFSSPQVQQAHRHLVKLLLALAGNALTRTTWIHPISIHVKLPLTPIWLVGQKRHGSLFGCVQGRRSPRAITFTGCLIYFGYGSPKTFHWQVGAPVSSAQNIVNKREDSLERV